MDETEIDNIPGIIKPNDFERLIENRPDRKFIDKMYWELADHLGSYAAARLWLTLPDPSSFPAGTTPMDAILAGDAQGVYDKLKAVWNGAYG